MRAFKAAYNCQTLEIHCLPCPGLLLQLPHPLCCGFPRSRAAVPAADSGQAEAGLPEAHCSAAAARAAAASGHWGLERRAHCTGGWLAAAMQAFEDMCSLVHNFWTCRYCVLITALMGAGCSAARRGCRYCDRVSLFVCDLLVMR